MKIKLLALLFLAVLLTSQASVFACGMKDHTEEGESVSEKKSE